MELTGEFQEQVRGALISAFSLPGEIDIVVTDADMTYGDGQRVLFQHFNPPATPMPAAVNNLLTWVGQNDYLVQFLIAAAARSPRNRKLQAVMSRLGDLTATYRAQRPIEESGREIPLGEAERIVFQGLSFENVAIWLDDMARKRRAVCRIEPQPQTTEQVSLAGYGTGFLIAPDVVMTNDHVASRFYSDKDAASRVTCRFDFEVGLDGVAPAPTAGTPHKLHPTDWPVANSPEGQLDFALLRLERPAGDDAVGGGTRGVLTTSAYAFTPGEPVVILQHPMADPLKLAFGPVAEKPWAADRVAYRVNTEGGSSGSPCLTQGRLVAAIHHYSEADRNRGVLMSSILTHLKNTDADVKNRLKERGLNDLLK
jgi:hypothetical protein